MVTVDVFFRRWKQQISHCVPVDAGGFGTLGEIKFAVAVCGSCSEAVAHGGTTTLNLQRHDLEIAEEKIDLGTWSTVPLGRLIEARSSGMSTNCWT
jgi:hypothetical protein